LNAGPLGRVLLGGCQHRGRALPAPRPPPPPPPPPPATTTAKPIQNQTPPVPSKPVSSNAGNNLPDNSGSGNAGNNIGNSGSGNDPGNSGSGDGSSGIFLEAVVTKTLQLELETWEEEPAFQIGIKQKLETEV
jgi:hypothetical protein